MEKKRKILDILNNRHKGVYTNMTFVSPIVTSKEYKHLLVQKRVSVVVRFGIVYDHIQVDTIQFRDRTKEGVGELKWGQWDDTPYFRLHKENTYLRCTASRAPNHRIKTEYLINGQVVGRQAAQAVTRPSEWNSTKERYVFDINIDNIVSLRKEVL